MVKEFYIEEIKEELATSPEPIDPNEVLLKIEGKLTSEDIERFNLEKYYKEKIVENKTNNSETRDLNIIGGKEIGKITRADYKRFHLEHCRNDEIKFFSLARYYNRKMGVKEPYLKERIPGIDREIDIKVFDVPSSMKNDDVDNELKVIKDKFKSDMIEIFNRYLRMKYEDFYENGYESNEMRQEIRDFKVKLEILSHREAFYSRDLSIIVEKLKTFETIDQMKNEYPLNKVRSTVHYLLEAPYSIEQGYSKLVTLVDEKFFHEYDENNKQGNEKYLANNNNNNNNSSIKNDYDELTSKQKTVINDVIYESSLNLSAIKYSDEHAYNVQPLGWRNERKKSLETVKNIENYYSNQLIIKREPVKQMIRPKKFLSSNGKVSEPNNKEDVFYMDKDNKIEKARSSTHKYFKDKSSKKIQKIEYILPDEPEEVYIASKEEYKSSSSSLPSYQKFIAEDENGEYTFVEIDKNGEIANDNDIANKKLYSCKQVNVEYSEMLIPDKIKENKEIPEEKKSDVYLYKNGLVQSRVDDEYLKYQFKSDNSKYEGYAKFIIKGLERDNTMIKPNEKTMTNPNEKTMTSPNDTYDKEQKHIEKQSKKINLFQKSKKYLNNVQETNIKL